MSVQSVSLLLFDMVVELVERDYLCSFTIGLKCAVLLLFCSRCHARTAKLLGEFLRP